ncbi:MAG TPA: DUF3185 family protein [Candidatus Acidoferrum sp.]|jgi:hypothetical protein|nr:DUF3185 family protein [Candidatus Acidoferrum sp.]
MENNKLKGNIMNKGIGIALLVVGIALITYGFDASDSVSSEVSRTFTGAPTNKAMWLVLGGIASAIIGLAMSFRRSGRV